MGNKQSQSVSLESVVANLTALVKAVSPPPSVPEWWNSLYYICQWTSRLGKEFFAERSSGVQIVSCEFWSGT
jgi:hypothetical protein